MPIGLVAAGVGAAGAIGGALISSNASKSAAKTSATAATSAQNEQARQFEASQQAIREGAANANAVQGQQHDASLGALAAGQEGALEQQRNAAGQVADLQNGAFTDTANLQRGLYENSVGAINQGYGAARDANQPYLTAGTGALNKLAQLYGIDTADGNGNITPASGNGVDPNASFYQSPDYQFRMSEGLKGLEAGATARGISDSGATRKAAIKYAGNLASGEFNNYASRLAALAGVGQQAVGQNAAGTTNYVNAVTGANSGYGAQYGSLRTGTAGNIGNAITGAANNSSNIMTGTANQIAGANSGYATQYGNAQLGQGTNLASNATSYGNNYATQVQNAANTQANAGLVGANAMSNGLNGLAGTTAQYLNSNPNLFGSSYSAIPVGQTSGPSMGWT